MRLVMRYRTAVLWAAVAALAATAPAMAQTPPYPSPPPTATPLPPASAEAAEIAACLCLGQSLSALSAEMAAQQRSYDAFQDDLTRLDTQLRNARARLDVNDPQSVARFRQLVEQRDAAFQRSTNLATGNLSRAIERYNSRVNEYNARCSNRPRDSELLARVQATLSCPPQY